MAYGLKASSCDPLTGSWKTYAEIRLTWQVDLYSFIKLTLITWSDCAYTKHWSGGGTIFFGIGGHKFPKVPRQHFCNPPIWWSKQTFYDPPPPPGATMLKKNVTPNARSGENMYFVAISLNKIFIKICSLPIISWFFVTPPISHEKILWTPSFFMPPLFGRKW